MLRVSHWAGINRCSASSKMYINTALSTLPSPPPSLLMSDSTDTKRRHVCPHCGQACSTRSHLARHSRIHTGLKEYKCDYPGCEKRSSRLDNLRAHQRVHSGLQKSKGSAHPSLVSSPDILYQPPPLELFHSPASHDSDLRTSNGLQLFMPHFPPPRGPFSADQFSDLSLSRDLSLPPSLSRRMPSPMVRGVPDDT
ncbi:hypothetical protein B0H12DRAFT_1102699 [Mycena haematopus]|nr:hypothetical protein B0H12DRAFT_1102699 [Mycena haematopus]